VKITLRQRFHSLLVTGASNREIARDVAIGVFVSFSPLFGLQMLICLALVVIFKKLNKLAVFLGVQLSWFYPPMLYLDYVAGRALIGVPGAGLCLGDIKTGGVFKLWVVLKEYLPVLFVGSFVVGGIAAFITYTVLLRVLNLRRGRPA
jgi:uncharacterized protein (DUF2062 family)